MKEGFDIGLEMFGLGIVLIFMIDNMIYGGWIVLLGILSIDIIFDFFKIIFNMIIIQGVIGCQIFEMWYIMVFFICFGLDIFGIIID